MMQKKRKRHYQTKCGIEQLELRLVLDGSGLFSASKVIDIADGSERGVLVGDLDNDGDQDVIAISINDDDSSLAISRVYQNDGHGNFTAVGTTLGPPDPRPSTLADFDGDGDLDIAFGSSSRGLRIWANLGNFQFAEVPGNLLPPGISNSSIATADFDRDSDADIIANTRNGHSLLFNDGLGNFHFEQFLDGSNYDHPADFDRDGDLDIVTRSYVLQNDGTGHFPDKLATSIQSPSEVADFDGDLDLDVFVYARNASDRKGHIFFNDGSGRFTDSGQRLARLSTYEQESDSAIGDVDLDGDIDRLVMHANSLAEMAAGVGGDLACSLWLNDGHGQFTREDGPDVQSRLVKLADLDGDGDLDTVGIDGSDLFIALNRTVIDVSLPVGGGNFEIVRSGLDVVVRHVGGAELFREPVTGIKTLRIQGSSGNDRVDASALTGLALVLNGLAGNDTLIGGSAVDSINGGEGNDSISGNGGADQISGGAGNDWLSGNMGNDVINGGDDQDTLLGGAGNDELRGGSGNDALNGGAGNDRMYGDAGADVLRADLGNDLLDGGTEADTLVGDDGNDSLLGGDGDDLLRGVAGRDTLDGGTGNDDLRGGADNDSLVGGSGNDTLNGNLGNDSLLGGEGHDALAGSQGNDLLIGNAGRDTLLGGLGNDTLLGGADADILLGEAGNDSLNGEGDSRDTLNGGSGSNTLIGLPTEIDLAFTLMPDWRDRS